LQHGNDPALADAADITASVIAVPDTSSDGIFYLDHSHPVKRYARFVVVRGTQNATVASVFAISYGGVSVSPQGANVTGKILYGALAP
jgi:hypothetical protein